MNYSDYRFTLDIQIHQAQVSVPVTLNDTARKLYIGLTDGRKPYTIADGCRAVFAAKKPDGTTILNDCIIEKNSTIVYEFSKNTTSCEGIVNCEVRLYNEDGKELTSPQFLIVVDSKVVRDEEIVFSESESTTISTLLVTEQQRIAAEAARVEAEALRQQRFDSGEFKGEDGEPGYTPVRGVDYWTREDIDSIEAIVRHKASMIGGFTPVDPPLWRSGAKLESALATVTKIENNGGEHIITFNDKVELFTDGGFEQYTVGESLVPINNSSLKGANGWMGVNFDGASTRYANIVKSGSHSGNNYISVRSPYSSIFKSVKLKPNTDYTLSFWCKGTAGDHFSNVCIASKALDSEVYWENRGGAFLCDKNLSHYSILKDMWYHASDVGEYLEATDVWQQFSLNFRTLDEEYVDICIYFGTSYGVFGFDDFSITEDLGEVFTASYSAGRAVPEEMVVGSIFYTERNSENFSRFEYASSKAISDIYRHAFIIHKNMCKTAYEYALDGGYKGSEEEFTKKLGSVGTYTVEVPLSWTTEGDNTYQTISVNGVSGDDTPIADVVLGDDHDANELYLAAWARIARIETSNNAITLHCYVAPTTAFTIQLKAVV